MSFSHCFVTTMLAPHQLDWVNIQNMCLQIGSIVKWVHTCSTLVRASVWMTLFQMKAKDFLESKPTLQTMQHWGKAFPVDFGLVLGEEESWVISSSGSVSIDNVSWLLTSTSWIDIKGLPTQFFSKASIHSSSVVTKSDLLVSTSAMWPESGFCTLHSKAPAFVQTIVGYLKSSPSFPVAQMVSSNMTLIWVSRASKTSITSSPSAGPPWPKWL